MTTFYVSDLQDTPNGISVHLKSPKSEIIITPTAKAFSFNVKSRGNVDTSTLKFLIDDWYCVEKKMRVTVGDEVVFPKPKSHMRVLELSDTRENREKLEDILNSLIKEFEKIHLTGKVLRDHVTFFIKVEWNKKPNEWEEMEIEDEIKKLATRLKGKK